MSSSSSMAWLAFDIGAKKHAYAFESNGKRETGTIDNSPEKLRVFLNKHVRKEVTPRLLVEATGVYYLDTVLIAHGLNSSARSPVPSHDRAHPCSSLGSDRQRPQSPL